MRCRVTHVGVYRHAQKWVQTVNTHWIGLGVSGMVRNQRILPGGFEEIGKEPRLFITPPGTRVDFEYNHKRENWVIMLETDDMRYVPETQQSEIRFDGVWVPVQRMVPVPREWVPRWQREFQGMLDAFRSSLPRDRLHLELSVYNVIRYMLEPQPHGLAASPAQDLRRRIDADQSYERSLEELSEECGYSSDHLRLLFEKEFHISPRDYRQKLRMARAMDLIAASRLSVKEISQMLGFRQLSHFSACFRDTYALSPRAAIVRFRNQG